LAPLGSLVAAIGGWIITYTILIRGFKEQEAVRVEERSRQDKLRSDDQRHSDGARIESFLVESLRYFEGGTQHRSIGISMIEAYWRDFPRLRSVWRSVLSNQAIYVLSKVIKEGEIPLHEADNLSRIYSMLETAPLTLHQEASLVAAEN